MKTPTIPLALASLITTLPLATALRLTNSDNPAVIHAPIQRRSDIPKFPQRRIQRRQDVDGTVYLDLDNEQTLYFADVSVGDPPQQLRLHVDTGSSDMWMNAATSELCQLPGDYCSISGTYSANSSTSSEYVNSAFNISYLDGSAAIGDYVSDSISIGNLSLPRLQFGVGYDSSSSQGILGLGYPAGEVQVLRAGLPSYPNLPAAIVESGAIRTPAYSLWLNDLDASMGSILFGGVDQARYTDPLLTVPIIPQSRYTTGSTSDYLRFIIALTALGRNNDPSLTLASSTTDSTFPIPVLLDSGSSITYLPTPLVESLFTTYQVRYSSRYAIGVVDCALASSADTLDFTFSNSAVIRVPLNELVITNAIRRNGEAVCIFGIAPNEGSTSILGDTFLRSAYVVYDLQANEISLAQTDFNATESRVVEIAGERNGDGGGVPGAQEVADPVTDVSGEVDTGTGRIGNDFGGVEAGAGAVRPMSLAGLVGAVVLGLGAIWAL